METFALLSRGGAKFDKKRFSKDVQLFHGSSTSSSNHASSSGASSTKALDALKTGELPAELDFFKYAAGGSASAGLSASKKGKEKAKDSDDEDSASDDDAEAIAGKKRKRGQDIDAGTSAH